MHNISITLKMIKKIIKNCEPELSYILAEFFSMCLKESCFPDCWKVSSVVPVFKNVEERATAKNYHPVSLLSLVSKVFEKLLKLASFIFYQIFIFHQMIALQKLWKIFFISSKKLFSFSRYSNFCIFNFPSFSSQPLLQVDSWKI